MFSIQITMFEHMCPHFLDKPIIHLGSERIALHHIITYDHITLHHHQKRWKYGFVKDMMVM